MTLSAALDSDLAFAVVIVFFGFICQGWLGGFRWRGTDIYKQVSVNGRSEMRTVRISTNLSTGL